MKAKRLIVHLGHGKTGSTSIQRALRASPDVLRDAGALFPAPGRHDNHQLLFPHLHGSLPDDPVQLASLGSSPARIRTNAAGLWQELLDQIAIERPETIILSCENQFRPFDRAAMERLCAHCAELAEQTEVIAYLRDPAGFFLSNVQQDVKKRPEFRPISPSRYRDTLDPFLHHGPGPVSAVRFARDALQGGDVVTDFAGRMLPGIDPARLDRGKAEENTSVSAEAMALLQEVFRGTRALPKAYAKDKKALRKIIVAADADLPGQVRPKLFEPVREVTEARVSDLEWLEAELSVTFPNIGAPQMPRYEAEAAYANLRDVRDICAVDDTRQEALWQEALDRAKAKSGPLARLSHWLKRG